MQRAIISLRLSDHRNASPAAQFCYQAGVYSSAYHNSRFAGRFFSSCSIHFHCTHTKHIKIHSHSIAILQWPWNIMLQIFLFHFFHLVFISTGSIHPSNLQNMTLPGHLTLVDPNMPGAGISSIADNTSLLADPPVISFAEGSARLPGKACLMVALEALVQLSFKDMSEPYTQGIFISDDYPEVLIRITSFQSPGRETSQPTSLAIVCLIKLITGMMYGSKYRNSSVISYWKSGRGFLPLSQVAFFGRKGATIQDAPALTQTRANLLQTPSLTNLTKIDFGSNIASAGTNDDDDEKLVVFAEFLGGTLPIDDVFFNIYESITYIAQFPTTDAMAPFEVRSADTNAQLSYKLIDPPDLPPRPTFVFQWGWAARSLQKLPKYMFEQRKFNEIKFISGWDKTLFGVGQLTKYNA